MPAAANAATNRFVSGAISLRVAAACTRRIVSGVPSHKVRRMP